MGNDFTGDSDCVALFRFESGALIREEISDDASFLTDVNTVGTNTTDHKEGSACADFESVNGEYFYFTESKVGTDFPFKSGTSNKKILACFWIQPESFYNYTPVFGKYELVSNGRTVIFGLGGPSSSDKLAIYIGYNSGNSFEQSIPFGSSLTAGKSYHVGMALDANTGDYRIRVYDYDTSALLDSDVTGTFSNSIYLSTTPYSIGSMHNSFQYDYDGLVDELVIFKDFPADSQDLIDKIDAIRAGTYSATGGTTGVIAAALNDAVCAFSAQTGTGGGVSATAEPAALSQSAAIGWQGPIVSAINQAVGNVSGVIGATGALEPGASPVIMDLAGGGGATGVLTGGVPLSALLFGTTSDTPAIVYEGTISSTAQAISMQAGGNTGLTGEVLTQVLVSAALAGALGATGVGTMSVPGIDTLVTGVTGLTGEVSATVTTGADIAAKIGVSGVIVSSLEALGLQLVEVTISERIYSVIISTATGRAVFLAPAAGEINISTET